MQIRSVAREDIVIADNRQRRTTDPGAVISLGDSIHKLSLLHPVVIRQGPSGKVQLVAGENRLKALEYLWSLNLEVSCCEQTFKIGQVPCLYIGDLDPIDAFEAELDENTRRQDLSWQDKASATAKLLELRSLQAKRDQLPEPTVAEVAEELRGTSGGAYDTTRKEILIAKHLDRPEVAKAQNVDQAFKILKRQEELKRSEELGKQVGATFGAHSHTLLQGNCTDLMKTLDSEQFDVILTDPPYGIGADDFSDSGGKTPGEHFYDDSPEVFFDLMEVLAPATFRVAKAQAHLYLFCDIEHFLWLRFTFKQAGWKVFRTPLIWNNPTAMRAPWPEQGPQRKWQMVLYAVKGNKPANQLGPDLITFPSDVNLNHHAQKPVALYQELLKRSTRPADAVLDPFCGSGTIFPAAHGLKVKATGIELDAKAYGIAVERLGKLK